MTLPIRLSTILISTTLVLLSSTARADWVLDNEASRLSFISIKATDVGEVHSFTHLDGAIDSQGAVSVTIQLASVETLVPVRNERMREMLFDTGAFPTANLTAQIDAEALSSLQAGELQSVPVEASLQVKEQIISLTFAVVAARLGENRLLVTSRQPIIITAAAAGLSDGVEKLREVAGLPNISQAVPVSFVLIFQREGD